MENDYPHVLESVASEFACVSLGDKRRSSRLTKIVDSLAESPQRSIPQAMGSPGATEAFYRFVGNASCTFSSLLDPHMQQSKKRVAAEPLVIVAHDTTEFRYEKDSKRKNLGELSRQGVGFFAHISLAISPDESRDSFGVLNGLTWARRTHVDSELYRPTTWKESNKWGEAVEKVRERIAQTTSVIHVMDREADDYALYASMLDHQDRFVVRSKYDRLLHSSSSNSRTVKEHISHGEILCSRTVKLSRRRAHPRKPARQVKTHRPRDERVAQLTFQASCVEIQRPKHVPERYPESLRLNVVHVKEIKTPTGETPVEWLLLTTEPVTTQEQILRVVDAYRRRWVVEEFFHALKTGCGFSKRQLENEHSLLNMLAISLPIAWSLLRLRNLGQTSPGAIASTVLPPSQIKVLRAMARKKLPPRLSIQRAMLEIAKMGGHLPQNGPPGWKTLAAGYRKLLEWEKGYLIATQSRCDQV